ncbi:MAG: DUF11 domain-containing protein, partial [Candidatus Harrisonbacteria bacterium]|nr:DUF11 domain-containing protein [Candidatus Harrisonbacteria bacterium]
MSGKLFGIFLLFAALLGGGYIVYTYISGGNADIAIAIATPDRVLLGVPFTVTVGVNNASRNVLRAAEVALELPEGAAFLRERREKTVLIKSLGDVGEGSLLQEEFSVLLFGDSAQSLKRFAAVVRYAPSGGGARFEKRQEFIVVADAPGMLLDIIAPEAAVSGEEFEVALSVKNVSDADVHGLRLVADYPAGFEFKKSSLAPDVGNNTWQLGDLRTGSETTLSIRGNVIGPASSTYELRVRLEADFFGERYVVGEKTARVAVAESPLVLTLSVNDNPEYLAGPNETLNYTIAYANNANDALQNAVLKVQLAGALFDLSSLRADGAA